MGKHDSPARAVAQAHRRAWRLRLAQEWLDGWSFWSLAIKYNLSWPQVEEEVRRAVKVKR